MAAAIQEHSGRENDRELGAADLGDLPMIVLTAGRAFASSTRVRADALQKVQHDWVQYATGTGPAIDPGPVPRCRWKRSHDSL